MNLTLEIDTGYNKSIDLKSVLAVAVCYLKTKTNR